MLHIYIYIYDISNLRVNCECSIISDFLCTFLLNVGGFFVYCVITCVCFLAYSYILFSYVCITLVAGCWLEVSIRKVLRPATSAQGFLGFPVPISEC